MSFSPYLISLTPLGALLGSPIPSKTKVMEEGELPVDVLEISAITFLSNEQGDGKDSAPKRPRSQNAFAPPLAPSGGEGKWIRKADMPTARHWLSTSVVGGRIYAIGGWGDGDNILSVVEEYDPVEDKWIKKADMPTTRYRFSASAVNGKVYAIGGGGMNGLTSTVEEYDTGFAGEGIDTEGKLPTMWGGLKRGN
jgi:hypothetical protein